jgi:putative peptidoglycan lipid II flippase
VGYLCGLAVLLACRGIVRTAASAVSPDLVRGMAKQYLANQSGSLVSLVGRYFQSFLTSGGISALGYTGQIVNNLSSLMSFREIYVAPLASEDGRSAKLERMLCGIVLVSVPIACFVVAFAEPIVRILFQRGNFTASASALTANVMQIMALSLLFTPVLAPMLRLFQILDRVSYVYALYLFWFAQSAVLQFILIFKLGWDVQGIAWSAVANSAGLALFGAFLLQHCGIHLNWRPVFSHAAIAIVIAGAGLALSMLVGGFSEGLVAAVIGGAAYWLVVAAGYLLIRDKVRAIVG